jgi:hypothetical protein
MYGYHDAPPGPYRENVYPHTLGTPPWVYRPHGRTVTSHRPYCLPVAAHRTVEAYSVAANWVAGS